MAGVIDSAHTIGKGRARFGSDCNIVALEESSNEATKNAFAITISISGGSVEEVSTSLDKGATLICRLVSIGIASPCHRAKAQARESKAALPSSAHFHERDLSNNHR